MSGWVAARLITENASARGIAFERGINAPLLPVTHAFASSSTGTAPAPGVANRPPPAGMPAIMGPLIAPQPAGVGASLGMGPLRLEMSLSARLAALAAKREERDKRVMVQRRYYIQQLRNFYLEGKVSGRS
jgi:hypothetical protein